MRKSRRIIAYLWEQRVLSMFCVSSQRREEQEHDKQKKQEESEKK